MKLLSVTIGNYKCFQGQINIDFGPCFNILVGKNDAGKSALIEAIGLRHSAVPHRSLETAPDRDDIDDPVSACHLKYALTADDLHNYFSKQKEFSLPTGPAHNASSVQSAMHAFRAMLETGSAFTAQWSSESRNQIPVPRTGFFGAFGDPQRVGQAHLFSNNGYPNKVVLSQKAMMSPPNATYHQGLASWLRERSYAFRAERLNLSSTAQRGSTVLSPDASNLAEVLNTLLSGDKHTFSVLMDHLREIFPHITDINPIPKSSGEIEVMVSTVDPKKSRGDLDVSLRDSGTGIGQVLAMLYVVVQDKKSRIIMIDEPQSFLHPGAVKKLMEVLRQYRQHQYIITTHSPVAVSQGSDDRLFIVRREEAKSIVLPISPDKHEDLRMTLAEVGIRLSDVFGVDSILWVEGKTEEMCFPELITTLGGRTLHGVQVLGVVSTDELAAKQARRVFDIYARLSEGASLLPPATAFVLDPEDRSLSKMKEMQRLSNDKLHWFPRRMYENYLLEPDAITHVLNEVDRGRIDAVTEEDVLHWIRQHGEEERYFEKNSVVAYETADWAVIVKGATVLRDIFSEFTEQRVTYDKVRHGAMLTKYLVRHPTEAIKELAEWLTGLLP